MVGKTLGQYRIESKLGSGGMGDVYVAEDTKLNRQVALKVLPAAMAEDPERRGRFEREAKAVAALNHPNIVTIHSVEEVGGLDFLTMELVQGRLLTELIPERGMPLREFFDVAIPLTDAVGSAHEAGVTHRDLKPDNVMIGQQGRLKVLDFGLAKLTEQILEPTEATLPASGTPTQQGMILGTVAYMSPEQAQGQFVDHRSDIFSLGIMLYEMATGERPFKGESNISVLSSIIKDTPADVNRIKASLPGTLGRIIHRALEKEPAQRYQSAMDLRSDLEDLRQEVETGEILASGPSRRRPGAIGGRRWNVPLLASVVVVALVALAFAFWNLAPGRDGTAVSGDPDARPSLAVFYFENLSDDPSLDWLRAGLTDMLVTDLSQSPNLRVLDTARLYQILQQQDRLEEKQTSFEAVQAVARQADVTMALVGSFMKAGPTIRISARLQDARSGEIVTSEQVQGEGESSIFTLVDDLTRRIKGNFDLPTAAGIDRDLEDVSTSSLEAYRYYAEGIALHESLKEEQALLLLEKAVEVDPNFAMALAKLSVVHGNLNHWEQAKDYAEQALRHVDRLTDRERYYIEGRYHSLQPKGSDRAIEAYQRAVELFPDHTAARNNLAALLMAERRTTEAIRHLEELRRTGMTFPGTYAALAEAYSSQGDMERGHQVLLEYSERYPDTAASHLNLAKHLESWGKYDESLEALRAAEAIDPGHMGIEELRWVIYVLTERWDEAEAAAGKMLGSREPFYQWRGGGCQIVNRLYSGRLGEALSLLEQGATQFQDSEMMVAETRGFASLVYYDLGRCAEALEQARLAVEAAGDFPGRAAAGHAVTAMCLTSQGDPAAAAASVAAFGKATESLPVEHARMGEHYLAGKLAAIRGDLALALDELEQARSLLPPRYARMGTDHSGIWYDLATTYLEAGRNEEAAEWFRQLVDSGEQRLLHPVRYVRSLFYLAKIHEARGEMERARDYYRRFLDHWRDGRIDRELVEEAARKIG